MRFVASHSQFKVDSSAIMCSCLLPLLFKILLSLSRLLAALKRLLFYHRDSLVLSVSNCRNTYSLKTMLVYCAAEIYNVLFLFTTGAEMEESDGASENGRPAPTRKLEIKIVIIVTSSELVVDREDLASPLLLEKGTR